MGDEGPSAVTDCVIVHHILGVCLAEEGRRTRAPLHDIPGLLVLVGWYVGHNRNNSPISFMNSIAKSQVTVRAA